MTTFIYLVIYLLLLTSITWSSAKEQTPDDYVNSSKSLTSKETTWTTFASLLTGYNFVLGVTFSYLFGLWYIFIFGGAALAFVVLYFFYTKHLSALQPTSNLFSIGDYFGIRFGKSTQVITNIVLAFALFLFLVLQIFVNTQLFSGLLGTSTFVSLCSITGVVCAYLWFGGFKTSVRTDILQGILLLPIVLTVFFFPPHFSSTTLAILFPAEQFWFAVGFALLQFFSLVAQAESFQRVFAVKNSHALGKGLIYSFILLCIVAFAIAYIGITFKLSGAFADPNTLFVENVLTVLPHWLSSLLTVSLVAAFMGTIDSSAFALGSILSNSLHHDAKKIVFHTRIYITLSILVSAIASVYLFSFLSSVFALISVISVIGLAIVVALFFKKVSTLDVNMLLIIGIATFIFGLLFNFVTDNPLTALLPSGAGLLALFVTTTSKKLLASKTVY